MSRIGPNSIADLFFQITWSSDGVRHNDAYAGQDVNFWRDMLPPDLHHALMGRQTGDRVRMEMTGEQLIGNSDHEIVKTIQRSQFDGSRVDRKSMVPRVGRFYPRGVLEGEPGIFRANVVPFRCIHENNGHLEISLDHPLTGKFMDVQVTVGSLQSKLEERGGGLKNWGEIITQGIGMQSRWRNQPTDFFSDIPFRRQDESPDAVFYERPRLVPHLDDTAISMVSQIYERFMLDGMSVLDLMSSWQSHLPENVRLGHVTGLGLNARELQQNDRLDERVIHDLNADARLPFDKNRFDVVVCNVSVEYLIFPFKIFEEVARVLKAGGTFIVTFSNRWFDPKAIRIWKELHEFERMGMVLEYFRHTSQFDQLETYSIRGLGRPANDKYAKQYAHSDPVYAVWGKKT